MFQKKPCGLSASKPFQSRPLSWIPYFTAALAVSLVTVFFYANFLHEHNKGIESYAVDRARFISETFSAQLNGFIDDGHRALNGIVEIHNRNESNERPFGNGFEEFTAHASKTLDGLDEIGVIDRNGKLISTIANSDALGRTLMHRFFFAHHRDNDSHSEYISYPFHTARGHFVITISKRLNDASGAFDGVVFTSIPVSKISENLQKMGFFHKGLVAIGTPNGTIYFKKINQVDPVVFSYVDRLDPELTAFLGRSSNGEAYTAKYASTGERRPHAIALSSIKEHGIGSMVAYDFEALVNRQSDSKAYIGKLVVFFIIVFSLFEFNLYRSNRRKWARAFRWSLALENSEQSVIDWDIKRDRLYLSDRLCSILGCQCDHFESFMHCMKAHIHPDDLQRFMSMFDGYLSGSHGERYLEDEFRLDFGSPEPVWHLWRLSVVEVDLHGKPQRIIGVIIDIHDQHRMRNEILAFNANLETLVEERTSERDSANKVLRLATDAAQIGFYEFDLEKQTAYWSPRVYEIIGFDKAPEEADCCRFPGLSRLESIELFKSKRRTDEGLDYSVDHTHCVVLASGEMVWIHVIGRAEHSRATGALVRLYGVIIDITARKHIEEALRCSEAALRRAQAVGLLGNWHCDIDRKKVTLSEECCRIYGLFSTTADVSLFDGITHPQDKKLFDTHLSRAAQGKPFDFEYRIIVHGKTKWVRIRGEPEHQKGELKGIFGVAQDITDRKQIELDLIQAKESAEASVQSKSDFLANISHEIRTPIHIIAATCDGLLHEAPLHPARGKLERIKQSADYLLELLNGVLNLTKLNAKQFELEYADFNLDSIASRLRALFCARAPEKPIHFQIKIDPRLEGLHLMGAPLHLTQVMLNLGSNAIKFTDQGEINVLMTQIRRSNEDVVVKFTVTDTGIGISERDQKRIFEPFMQVDTSLTRRYSGTGLGLPISKHLIEMMGGAMMVESAPGKGSIFSFTLCFPISAPPRDDFRRIQACVLRTNFEDVRILLVDDHATGQAVMLEMLDELGVAADVADDGEEALAIVKQSNYDLILMDLQMPRMDGLSATRAIRKLLGYGDIPIIALTAKMLSDTRTECLDAGMNDYLSKPVSRDRLAEVLSRWLPSENLLQAQIKTEPPPSSDVRQTNEALGELHRALSAIEGIEIEARWQVSERKLARYYTLLRDFVTSSINASEGFAPLVPAQDHRAIEHLAHQINGAAALVGAMALSKLAAELEHAAVHKFGQADLEVRVKALLDEQARLNAALSSVDQAAACVDSAPA